MPFSKDEQDRIGKFLGSRGVPGCLACGFQGGFLFGDVGVVPTAITPGSGISGPSVVPIACPRCGYVMLFDATILPLPERDLGREPPPLQTP